MANWSPSAETMSVPSGFWLVTKIPTFMSAPLARRAASVEQRQVDRVAHRAVAQVARVEVVAAIADRQHARRMLGIAQGAVEIDERVEDVALAQPVVDRLARRLPLRVPGAGQEGL